MRNGLAEDVLDRKMLHLMEVYKYNVVEKTFCYNMLFVTLHYSETSREVN
jgi:hypothetical protein